MITRPRDDCASWAPIRFIFNLNKRLRPQSDHRIIAPDGSSAYVQTSAAVELIGFGLPVSLKSIFAFEEISFRRPVEYDA